MTIESPAIERVRIVAERLGDLREEVVFLGGATVGEYAPLCRCAAG